MPAPTLGLVTVKLLVSGRVRLSEQVSVPTYRRSFRRLMHWSLRTQPWSVQKAHSMPIEVGTVCASSGMRLVRAAEFGELPPSFRKDGAWRGVPLPWAFYWTVSPFGTDGGVVSGGAAEPPGACR